MSIQLNTTDFTQLRNILMNLPEFKTASGRLAFLNEMLQGSPRQDDILGGYMVDGPPRSRAIALITHLCHFGQDTLGHESLNHLLTLLLDYHGEGETATFLHGLQTTITIDPPTESSANSQLSGDWTPQHSKQLYEALLGAFNHSSLKQMVRWGLNKQLDHLVAQGSLSNMIFGLIEVAEREEWVVDLTHAAHKANPGNQKLARFAAPFLKDE